ncbi:hypothetical protein ACFLQP_02045 [Acidobacteriota bacterium]
MKLSEKPIIYLDQNVIIDLEKSYLKQFEQILLQSRENGEILIPFSSTHIYETNNITGKNRKKFIQDRLSYISRFTGNLYLNHSQDVREFRLKIVKPEIVYRGITEPPTVQPIMHDLLNVLPHKYFSAFRDALTISVNELNNFSPPNVIEQIESYLNKKYIQYYPDGQGFKLRPYFKMCLGFNPGYQNFGLFQKMPGFFSLLNTFGYNPDKKSPKSIIAGFYDSDHAANAACADYFVTNDKKLEIKSLVAYEFFEVETKVLNVENMTDIIKNGWLVKS